MNLLALPALADNYIWMLHDGFGAIVVDPGDAAVVERELDRRHLALKGILVTHHHGDHTGGVDALRPRLQGPVYGPAAEPVPEPCERAVDGDEFALGGREVRVIGVPGHTLGHLAYFIDDGRDDPIVFCGDTLFSAGCGRLFEGTPGQMSASLARLAALPGLTRVCCAHEYTMANLRFAAAVEPDNTGIARWRQRCEAERARGEPTLPSWIGVERDINPFLRCGEPGVIDAARSQGADSDDPVAVFATLREWKNQFR